MKHVINLFTYLLHSHRPQTIFDDVRKNENDTTT